MKVNCVVITVLTLKIKPKNWPPYFFDLKLSRVNKSRFQSFENVSFSVFLVNSDVPIKLRFGSVDLAIRAHDSTADGQ